LRPSAFFPFLHAKFRTADVDSVRCPLRRHPHGPLAAPPTAPTRGSVITFIIWLLLFMLGTEVGGNEEVMRSLATLGVQALVLCTGALAGSIACAWLLWRSIGGRRTGATDSAAPAPPAFAALRGSLVIVAFFAAGAIFGVAGWIPATAASSPVSTYMLYGLMFSVGVSLGHDATLVERIRSLDRRCRAERPFPVRRCAVRR